METGTKTTRDENKKGKNATQQGGWCEEMRRPYTVAGALAGTLEFPVVTYPVKSPIQKPPAHRRPTAPVSLCDRASNCRIATRVLWRWPDNDRRCYVALR